MGQFLDKTFKVNKKPFECYTKTYTFKNDPKGLARGKKKLFQILTKAYMDELDQNGTGKIEDDEGKYVKITPRLVGGMYDMDMVWKDLIRTGTVEPYEEIEDEILEFYLS